MVLSQQKIKGATLLESLTALAIVTSVFIAAFTVYNQTVIHQSMVAKTRALVKQTEVERLFPLQNDNLDLTSDFFHIDVQHEPYKQSNDLKHYTLTISSKDGKIVKEKHYIRYCPKK